MSPAKRIIVNVLATYGRSIVSLLLGLLTTRWILAALGKSDFGLFGVVGSVVFFVTFINEIFTQSVSRFYAFAIGKEQQKPGDGHIADWFNTALSIHSLLPVVLLVVGLPVGEYAVRHWLVIPPDRIEACIWVFRCALGTAVFTIVSVPYRAMFFAYQLITEVVVFTLLQVALTCVWAYCLLFVNGDRLIWYGAGVMSLQTAVMIGQMFRARYLFPDCRIDIKKMFNGKCLVEIFGFFGSKLMQGAGWALRGNGSALLVNVRYGEIANASFSVAQTLSGQAVSFSASLVNAFAPAVTTAMGAGNRVLAESMACRSSKFGSLLVLIFGIPLVSEMDNWLHIWLGSPPDDCYGICLCMVATFMMDNLTIGHHLLLTANGKIFYWQLWESLLLAFTLVIGAGLSFCGFGLVSIGWAYISTFAMTIVVRLVFCKKMLDMSVKAWVLKVLLPISALAVLGLPVSVYLSGLFGPTLFRLLLNASVSTAVLMTISWFILLDSEEKSYVVLRARNVMAKFVHRG